MDLDLMEGLGTYLVLFLAWLYYSVIIAISFITKEVYLNLEKMRMARVSDHFWFSSSPNLIFGLELFSNKAFSMIDRLFHLLGLLHCLASMPRRWGKSRRSPFSAFSYSFRKSTVRVQPAAEMDWISPSRGMTCHPNFTLNSRICESWGVSPEFDTSEYCQDNVAMLKDVISGFKMEDVSKKQVILVPVQQFLFLRGLNFVQLCLYCLGVQLTPLVSALVCIRFLF